VKAPDEYSFQTPSREPLQHSLKPNLWLTKFGLKTQQTARIVLFLLHSLKNLLK